MFQNSKRILILRLSSLGDVILTTPVVRAIKKQFPNVKIDFLILHQFLDVLKYNPNINSIYTFTKSEGIGNIIDELLSNNYDFIIDLQNNRRSNKIVDELGIKSFSYTKPSVKKFLLVNTKINLLKKRIAIPTRYAENIDGLILDDKGPEIFIPDFIQPELISSEKNIGVSPGSKHFSKMWPKEYYLELCRNLVDLDFTPVLLGGKDDVSICNEIEAQVEGCKNLCSGNNLLQIVADMKMCKVIICNDSGMMHTATAAKVPVITIFGSTVQEFGFAPYNAANLILENNSVSCRPCSHIGRKNCPKKHFNCMKSITPHFVINEFLKYYNSL